MFTTATLTEFLGWASVINIGVLVFAALAVTLTRGAMISIHGKLFGLGEVDLSRAYFQYMAQYKLGIFIFNLSPYIALKIMGN